MKNKKYYYVYKITLTQKDHYLYNHYYYGARISIKTPENDYYKGSSAVIRRSGYWDKYPLDYKKEIIKTFDNQEDLYEYEKYIIGDKYKSDSFCLNRTIGGLGGNITWNKTDEEKSKIYTKMGEANKGRKHILKHPEITSKRLSEAFTGRNVSEETKKKISEANKGRKLPPRSEEYRRKLSESHKGKKLSQESVEKLRNSLKLHYKDPKNRMKLSEATKIAMNRPEVKQKCAEGGKTTKGKIFIKKDKLTKRIKPEELDFYINLGWKKGRYVSWIKNNSK